MRRVYLDHNATTPVDPRVLEAMLPILATHHGNPSSIHSFGREAKQALEAARTQVARLIGVEPRELIFLSGGTEADNLALNGVVGRALAKGKGPVHVICSAIEHPAVITTCETLGAESGAVQFDPAPVGSDGIVRLDALSALLRPETVLVSIMHANNEIGTIQPIEEIAKLTRSRGILLHVDAVQSAGKIPVNAAALGCDLLAISSHKIYGPKGVGALWVKKGVRLKPVATGGHQEREIRTGTENLPGIVGFGKACEIALAEMADQSSRLEQLRDALESKLEAEIPHVRVNGARDRRVPNTCNVAFAGLEGEAVVLALDAEGIACSTGSACTAGSVEPSHVLSALGLPPALSVGAVRFSLGKSTTEEEIAYVAEKVKTVVARLRLSAPASPVIPEPARA